MRCSLVKYFHCILAAFTCEHLHLNLDIGIPEIGSPSVQSVLLVGLRNIVVFVAFDSDECNYLCDQVGKVANGVLHLAIAVQD